jgi:hypothetical protein
MWVKTMHSIKFLAIVLILLKVGILDDCCISVWGTERIVVRNLLHDTLCIHHLTVIAKVILVIEVERKLILGRI